MMSRFRITLGISAATLAFSLAAAPMAFAQGKNDAMKNESMSKDSMKKDAMSKDSVSKGGMKKDDAIQKH